MGRCRTVGFVEPCFPLVANRRLQRLRGMPRRTGREVRRYRGAGAVPSLRPRKLFERASERLPDLASGPMPRLQHSLNGSDAANAGEVASWRTESRAINAPLAANHMASRVNVANAADSCGVGYHAYCSVDDDSSRPAIARNSYSLPMPKRYA